MLSAVCLGPVKIGSMTCGADPAVVLAAEDDVTAEPAVALVELARARAVGVVDVAAVVVLGKLAPDDVERSLERGEFREPVLELELELPNKSS